MSSSPRCHHFCGWAAAAAAQQHQQKQDLPNLILMRRCYDHWHNDTQILIDVVMYDFNRGLKISSCYQRLNIVFRTLSSDHYFNFKHSKHLKMLLLFIMWYSLQKFRRIAQDNSFPEMLHNFKEIQRNLKWLDESGYSAHHVLLR